jgi:citrate lyase subunit beta / citryl-CoA lyase
VTLRSLLYVPASRPHLLAKLPALRADSVILDLEDGVAPGDKSAARDHLREAWSQGWISSGPSWSVRVNAYGSPWYDEDTDLVEELKPPRTILAKAETPDAIVDLAEHLSLGEGRIGLMIETARGVGQVRALAATHSRVDLLILGSADLRLSLGARPDADRRWELHSLSEIVLAARMHGCRAIDSVFFHYREPDALAAHARIARDLGYDGKSCIHPDQVAPIHEVFSSTAEELAWAHGVLRAWVEQNGARNGVVVHDGEMIEALHLDVAERILERAP